jgi:hypothetical protein
MFTILGGCCFRREYTTELWDKWNLRGIVIYIQRYTNTSLKDSIYAEVEEKIQMLNVQSILI